MHTALTDEENGQGDEVITTPFTFNASGNTSLYTNARPVFVDIIPQTFNIDHNLMVAAITSRTRAIMRVHLFSLPCDMDAILSIAEKYGLKVIKEPARVTMQCIKASRLVLLALANFSLYPTKNMTSAEGGMITTNDASLAETSRVTRQHGMRCRYYHDELGFNHRMSEVQAAIGLARLRKLEHFNQVRREKDHYLSCHLIGVLTPVDSPACQHVYHQYTIRVKDGRREAFRAHLLQGGIDCEVYYPILIQLQRSYIRQMGRQASFPMVEHTSPEELSLPVPPALTQQDLEEVVQAENSFFQEN